MVAMRATALETPSRRFGLEVFVDFGRMGRWTNFDDQISQEHDQEDRKKSTVNDSRHDESDCRSPDLGAGLLKIGLHGNVRGYLGGEGYFGWRGRWRRMAAGWG